MTFRCRLDFLRHGESELSSVLRGSTDDALTAQGWTQMQHSVDAAADKEMIWPWQVVYSSPLQRCARFAEQVAQQHQRRCILHAQLQEMHFGAWEAQPIAELYAKYPEQLAQFWQHPSLYTPPQAETLESFQARVEQALLIMVEDMAAQQLHRALVVSHGGVIKLLKTLALKQEIDLLLTQPAELGQLHHFELALDDSRCKSGHRNLAMIDLKLSLGVEA